MIGRMSRNLKKTRGFTFLEIMIAVAILSIALVSLLRLVVLGIHNAEYDKVVTLATLLAREKLNEGLLLTEVSLNAEGRGEDEFSQFTWQRAVTPTVFNRIEQIQVTVQWLEGEEERNVVLTQFIFRG